MNNMKIEMLSTGDEVLYGQIVDTNAAWLSDFLFQQGFLVTSRMTVGDTLEPLINALRERSKINDIIIVNGGLGPTSDDLTAQAAAMANNEELVLHPEWLAEMTQYFASRNRTMAPTNIKQAMLPQSATLIDNPVGTACGFKMTINDCVIFFTPGVPSEFKEMVKNQILPDICQQYPHISKPICYRLTTMGRSESDLATEIEAKLSIPAGVSVGYRSAMPIIELKLTSDQRYQAQMDDLWRQLKVLVADNTIYEGATNLVDVTSQLLNEQSQSVIIIEQYTAGLIAYQLISANAPVIRSEVLMAQHDMPSYIRHLRSENPTSLILALYDFEFDNTLFKLVLSTEQMTYQYQLKYTSRKQHDRAQHAIFSAIGYDALRRYLTNQTIIGRNIWLDIVAEKVT